ncbi:tetratricopeptide repeat protein, partial [candidate division KSB1 bacterium]|nr:tetratricopeptide repeat protein [candidate division KSB1 bacterium]
MTEFKRALLVSIMCLVCVETAAATDGDAIPDQALSLGAYYLQQQNYPAAITEFKRFIFFHPDDEHTSAVYLLLSRAYAEQEQWDPAVKNIRAAMHLARRDSVIESCRITLATYFLAQGELSSAEFELTRLVHFSDNASIRSKALFFLGLCHVYQYKWGQARSRFEKVAHMLPDYGTVDSLLQEGTRFSYKSPQKAKWLSTFLPGAGQ